MTYEVQQTRWDRIIRRVSGSLGPGSRVSETISELFPMIDIENVPGELLLLGGTQISMGETTQSATVANVAQSMLRNPADSKNLLTLTQMVIFSGTAQIISLGPTLNVFANAGAEVIRDTRRGPAEPPVGLLLSGIALAPAPNFFRMRLNGTQHIVFKDRNGIAVIAPNSAFAISCNTVNTDLFVGYMWRERPAEESELQF